MTEDEQWRTEYLAVLGLEPGASKDEVRRAFRRQAAIHHPDRSPGDLFWQNILDAYEVLTGKRDRPAASAPEGDSWDEFEDAETVSADIVEHAGPPPKYAPPEPEPRSRGTGWLVGSAAVLCLTAAASANQPEPSYAALWLCIGLALLVIGLNKRSPGLTAGPRQLVLRGWSSQRSGPALMTLGAFVVGASAFLEWVSGTLYVSRGDEALWSRPFSFNGFDEYVLVVEDSRTILDLPSRPGPVLIFLAALLVLTALLTCFIKRGIRYAGALAAGSTLVVAGYYLYRFSSAEFLKPGLGPWASLAGAGCAVVGAAKSLGAFESSWCRSAWRAVRRRAV